MVNRAPTETEAVRVEGLRHVYGNRRALNDVSFTITRGEVFGLLGPNGGGKTTLFKILSTLLKPSGGGAFIFADPLSAPDAVRRHLGVVFQHPSLDGKLTVAENLVCHGHLYGLRGARLRQRADVVLERLGLTDRAGDRVETLSGGLQRRTELAKALGGTSLAVVQGMLLLCLAPAMGIRLSAASFLASAAVMIVVSLALTGLGLIIAWRMESTQGFHAIMNLILIPIWLLSGAFFPASGAPAPLAWLMRIDPLTYGMAALRRCLYLNHAGGLGPIPPLAPSLGISVAFCVVALAAAARTANRTAS